MIEITEFKAKHLEDMEEQEATAYLRPYFAKAREGLERSKYAYSVRVDGRLLLCFGLVEFWQGRGEVWAILDKNCKKEFVQIHGVAKRFLDFVPVKRVEASVDCHFKAGHRWVKSLGFKLEAPYREAYLPNGMATALYARVREA
jgi:hypothetical protein